MKQRIAIDMDEVIADPLARFFEWYQRDHGTLLTRELLTGKHPHEAVHNDHRELLRQYPYQPTFFKDLPVMPDSQAVVRQLTQRYEVFIASAAMQFKHSLLDKHEWLAEHFPFLPWQNIVFCGDKSIINADFLIDDNAFNFDNFRGEGILFDAPHNAAEQRYRRVHSWNEIAGIFL